MKKLYENRYYKGVNFDYILAIRYEDNKIEKHCLPIKKNQTLIDRMLRMVDDETYEAVDIYYAFKKNYINCGDFDFCLGQDSLMAYYIDAITYPSFDEIGYKRQAQEYKNRISSAKNEIIREKIQANFNKWNHDKKIKYIDKCFPYIFAKNYQDAIVEHNIEKTYFAYSNEQHGRFSYIRKITDDIKIELKTNFCYGSSSSLFVIVTYKDIPIVPYSIWVRYYYASYNEIIRCTRSYDPNRENWDNCMSFIIWFVSKAAYNPEDFVKETIMQEVDCLVSGIGELFKISDKEMEQRIKTSTPQDISLQEKYYIGIKDARMAEKKDEQYYTIAPEEATLVYRMEKITGALHFLKSLRQLSEIYDGIEQQINKIKEINALFYPEIINAIPPVRDYIANLKESHKHVEKRLNIVQKQFDYLKNKLEKKLEKTTPDMKDECKKTFMKNNPQYEKLRDELFMLENRSDSLKISLSNRENYLNKLLEAQLLVRKHVVINI